MSLDIFDVIESRCQWIIDVNDNNLPVRLLLVEQGHNSEDLDLLDLSRGCNELTNLADIERIVVTLGLGFRM